MLSEELEALVQQKSKALWAIAEPGKNHQTRAKLLQRHFSAFYTVLKAVKTDLESVLL